MEGELSYFLNKAKLLIVVPLIVFLGTNTSHSTNSYAKTNKIAYRYLTDDNRDLSNNTDKNSLVINAITLLAYTNVFIDDNLKESNNIKYKLKEVNSSIFHIFSHGKPGELFINNQWLHVQEIAVWLKAKDKLQDKKQLNIYGCEFAKGQKGQAAVAYLEKELKITVAASTNITGKDGDWLLETVNQDYAKSFSKYQYNLQLTGPTDDFDGDGINNIDDIDDDNDGIPDSIESPDCFPQNRYISKVFPNITATITSDIPITNPNNIDDNNISTNGNFPFGFRSDGTVFFQFDFGTGNSFQFDEIVFTDPLDENSFVWGTTNFNIEASNNATTWNNVGNITLLNGNSQQNPISIPITASTGYRYYRIVKNSGDFGSLPNAIGEVDFRFDGTLDQFQDFSCTDTDHFNLDSDGDGCSDAEEAFVAPANDLVDDGTLTNAKFDFISPTNDADGDGLYDSSSFDDSEGNRTDGFCPDVDGDGKFNVDDSDDDNDGILDVDEMDCTGFKTEINCNANLLESEGFVAGNELSNQLATTLGWVFSRDSDLDGNFTETIPLGVTCGELTLGVDVFTYSRPFKVESVSRSDGVTPTPFTDNVIQLRQDCAAGNEISKFDALDQNGMVLYTELLTQTGSGACVEVMLRPRIDVYQLIFYQISSATIITGNKTTKCIDIDTDMDGIPDRLDLDSDNDNCADFVEGGGSFTANDGAAAGGTASSGTGSSVADNLCADASCVDNNGLPINTGTPQSVSSSQDENVQDANCPIIIDAINDNFTSTPISGAIGGVVGDVTTNDTLDGVMVTDTDITITVDNNGGVTGLSIDANGNLTVPSNTIPGNYTITYTICEMADPTNCDTASVMIIVFEDTDGDGVSNTDDLDDDNDGILDTDEITCTILDANSDWTTSDKQVYLQAENNTGNGSATSGWESDRNSTGTLTVVDDWTFTSNTVNGTALTLTETDYTLRVITNNDANDGGVFTTTSSSFSSGASGNSAIGVRPGEQNTDTDGDFTAELVINFNKPVTSVGFELMDMFDNGDPVGDDSDARFTIFIDGVRVAYTNYTEYFGAGETAPVTILNGDGSSMVSPTLGQAQELFIGIHDQYGVEEIRVLYEVNGPPPNNNVGSDSWGFDKLQYVLSPPCFDFDGDGVPNHLDLDSDNDNCPDFIEGAGTFMTSDGETAGGTVSGGTGSTVTTNLCADNTCVNANGVPTITGSPQGTHPAVTDSAINFCLAFPDLSLTKTVNNAIPKVGDTIIYTLTVKNDGLANATGVKVTDVLPTGLMYVSHTPSGESYTGNVWDVGNVNIGSSKLLQITVKVNGAGTFTNIAEISQSNPSDADSIPNNNN